MMRPSLARCPSAPRGCAGSRRPARSPVVSEKATVGCAMARRLTTSEMAAFSARSLLRNLSRAGVAENSSRTSTQVPALIAAGRTAPLAPRSTTISCAAPLPALARAHGQMRHRPDRGQRLAAEAQRGDIEEVLVAQLGGGVALDRQLEVGGAHARAVVGDADEREATGRRHHLDVGRPRIERVLDQLLDHAARPLDHLAGGDAVDGLGAELADRHRH